MNETPRSAISRAGVRSFPAVALVVLLSLPVSAGGPWDNLFRCPCPVPDCIGKWCPDDYCPKKEPCVCVPLRFGCDNYCGKKEPCVCVPLCFGCDDYCGKCPPKVCSGPLYRSLKCGPSGQCCGCAKCDESPCDAYTTNPLEIKRQLATDADHQLVNEQPPVRPKRFPTVMVQLPDFKLTK
jgi:hypothetical protein